MINQKIVSQMSYSEQVELTRLEDEVSQAKDDLYFARMDKQPYMHDSVGTCMNTLDRCENNLNNYIAQMTKEVMKRMNWCEHFTSKWCDVCMSNNEPDTRSEEDAYWDNLEQEWYKVKQGL